MYLVCVDFSENNLLTEQLNVRSFYDLPVLNCSLLQLQLMNFVDASIEKAFIIDSEKTLSFPLFEIQNVNMLTFNKTLFSLDKSEKVLLIRNDMYFEFCSSEYKNIFLDSDIVAFEDENGLGCAVLTSVNNLKKLHGKSINFFELINNCRKYSDFHIKISGYVKYLNTVKSYKCLLFDILNGKTLFKPPYIAEGIFTDGSVPKGDFSIIPPVYLGERAQIESGSTIGPNAVIYNNSLISTDTSIKNSVLFENVYVSSGCYIDGAVCCENASVKRNSAVFAGSVIGANALIGEDMLVENNSVIKKNVKYDSFVKSPFTKRFYHMFENKFQGLSPDKASILGSALATVFKEPKILIASDGSPNSLAIKLAFLSGAIASGAECFDIGITFKSHIFFGLYFCECEYSIFISGKSGGTNIEIFNSHNEILSNADCCNLFDFCNKGEFIYVRPEECKNVRQIHGLRKMYIREISSVFDDYLKFTPVIDCKNDILSKTLGEIFVKVGNSKNNDHKIYINMNDSGTNVNIEYNDETYSQKTLKKIVHFYNKNDKNKIDFKNKYYENLWKKDSVFLLFAIFDIIKRTNKSIDELIYELPNFFVCSKSIEKTLKTGEMTGKLSEFGTVFYKDGAYNLSMKNGNVKIFKESFSDNIKVVCASGNMSVSEELCNFIINIFEDI